MASEIPPEDCTCEHLCPDGSGCIAIFVEDKSECWLLCPGSDAPPIPDSQLSLDARLNVQTKEVELFALAELLDSHCEMPLFVPAGDARKKVSLDMRGATLAEVIERTGLLIGHPQTPAEQSEATTRYLATSRSATASILPPRSDADHCPQCFPTMIVVEDGQVVAYSLTGCDGDWCFYESGPGGVV